MYLEAIKDKIMASPEYGREFVKWFFSQPPSSRQSLEKLELLFEVPGGKDEEAVVHQRYERSVCRVEVEVDQNSVDASNPTVNVSITHLRIGLNSRRCMVLAVQVRPLVERICRNNSAVAEMFSRELDVTKRWADLINDAPFFFLRERTPDDQMVRDAPLMCYLGVLFHEKLLSKDGINWDTTSRKEIIMKKMDQRNKHLFGICDCLFNLFEDMAFVLRN